MTLLTEIREQPAILSARLQDGREAIRAAAGLLREARFVLIAARGTSDNAARYAKYVWETINRVPVMLAGPSIFGIYESPPRLQGAVVVGLSQSGMSPDIVRVLEEGSRQGCPTVAITNTPGSPLCRAADIVVDVGACAEESVAATKSYTAQLLAIAMIAAAGADDPGLEVQLETLPDRVQAALGLADRTAAAAENYAEMARCVVLGRGYNYATAFEWALKIKELAYVAAEPYSSADFRHGPIAMITRRFPALAAAPSGRIFPDVLALLETLKTQHNARLAVISDEPLALDLADHPIPLPGNVPEWLSPIVSIIPAQLFCHHLALARGHDPDRPRGLNKVTLTQ
jgi:glucosamine--fructose-6-phosphate aminotransferase (isomerizing)